MDPITNFRGSRSEDIMHNNWVALLGGIIIGGYILGLWFLINFFLDYFKIVFPVLVKAAIVILIALLTVRIKINIAWEE